MWWVGVQGMHVTHVDLQQCPAAPGGGAPWRPCGQEEGTQQQGEGAAVCKGAPAAGAEQRQQDSQCTGEGGAVVRQRLAASTVQGALGH